MAKQQLSINIDIDFKVFKKKTNEEFLFLKWDQEKSHSILLQVLSIDEWLCMSFFLFTCNYDNMHYWLN